VNNARRHTVNKVNEFIAGNAMKRAPHSPYSPGLAPCDFYLSEYIKGRLACASFKELDQLLHAIGAIFQSIEKGTLEHMVQQWMYKWTQYCVVIGG
jgi:hypothetical protein